MLNHDKYVFFSRKQSIIKVQLFQNGWQRHHTTYLLHTVIYFFLTNSSLYIPRGSMFLIQLPATQTQQFNRYTIIVNKQPSNKCVSIFCSLAKETNNTNDKPNSMKIQSSYRNWKRWIHQNILSMKAAT